MLELIDFKLLNQLKSKQQKVVFLMFKKFI